jgi:hypothetical protein
LLRVGGLERFLGFAPAAEDQAAQG